MSRQAALFAPLPRAKPVKRMHFCDAGTAPDGKQIVHFRCERCGHDAGWWTVGTITEAKRGEPCPRCNL